MRMIALTALLLGTACNIPPKDPFAEAERALRRNELLQALQAYDAVPVAHIRYPDARAAAGDVEQRMRRCHELILEALRLRSEWRDDEALEALQRARQHWPQQPSLDSWIAATEKRMQLFAERAAPASTPMDVMPSAPMVEVARVGRPQLPVSSPPGDAEVADPAAEQSSTGGAHQAKLPSQSSEPAPVVMRDPVEIPAVNVPQPMLPGASGKPMTTRSDVAVGESADAKPTSLQVDPAAERPKPGGGDLPSGGASAVTAVVPETVASDSNQPSSAAKSKRLPTREDPVVLGLVAVEGRLSRGELALAVRDLIELSRRFRDDVRVNRRLSRLLHQRALMSYGQGAVAAAVTDWRRVLEIEPGNRVVQKLLDRALAESRAEKKS